MGRQGDVIESETFLILLRKIEARKAVDRVKLKKMFLIIDRLKSDVWEEYVSGSYSLN